MDNPAIYTTPGDDRLEAAERRITELEAENKRLRGEVERLRLCLELSRAAFQGGAMALDTTAFDKAIERINAALRGESDAT